MAASRETQDRARERLIGRTNWSASDVEELSRLSTTRQLIFQPGSRFEPGALGCLAALPRLKFLRFQNGILSRADLEDLARLPALLRLDLSGCRLHPSDLEALGEPGALPTLTDLWLEHTGIGDQALPFVARLSGLQWLILGGTRISDEGLVHLRTLSQLRTLWVNDTDVSDKGLLQLSVLPKLSILNIKGSNATQNGLDALFAAQMQSAKNPQPLDDAERQAAQQVLRDFMEAMNRWETEAARKGGEIQKRHQSSRPAPNVMAPEEAREDREFWAEIGRQKAAIIERFCTPKKRAYAGAFSYGNPPVYDPSKLKIVDAEVLGRRKIALFTNEGPLDRRRFVMMKKGERWLIDSKQRWSEGWQRDIL